MKSMFEEYGGVIVTTLTALSILGLILLIVTPGNPLHDIVVNLIMSAMP